MWENFAEELKRLTEMSFPNLVDRADNKTLSE